MVNVFELYVIFVCSFYLAYCQVDQFTSWNINTPMVEGQSGLMAGYHATTNKIWLIGGLAAQNEIWQYDINNNSFIDNGNMSLNVEKEFSKSYATAGDYIYFPHYDILYRFNMANGILDPVWNRSFLHPNISAPCLSIKDNRYIFILGGTDESPNPSVNASWISVSTFQIYDIVSDTWHTGNPLNTPREWYTCEISPDGNWFYAFGGVYYDTQESALQYTETFEKLHISDMSLVINASVNSGWQLPLPNLLKNNFYHQRSTVDLDHNLIYLIGGFNGTEFGSNAIQIFNPLTDNFYISFSTLNIGRTWPTVIYVKQKVYVFGGENITPQNSYEISNYLPTNNPTLSPTFIPSNSPSINTNNPSIIPTISPSKYPSISPLTYSPTQIGQTRFPSISPTKYPSKFPTINPSQFPSKNPSISPTKYPSISPSKFPTLFPTKYPTFNPSITPTLYPSISPSKNPSRSPLPNGITYDPSISPTFIPSNSPSINTNNPSISPLTSSPTQPGQTLFPSIIPSENPSKSPIILPTKYPSVFPSKSPIVVTIANTIANTDDHGQSSNSGNGNSNIGLIIGLIIGAIILFGLIIFCFFYCKKKEKLKQTQTVMKVESIDLQNDGNYTVPQIVPQINDDEVARPTSGNDNTAGGENVELTNAHTDP